MSLSNVDWQDVLNRASWTFVQAFVPIVAAAGVNFVDGAVWKSAALAGGAAVLSFLKNVFVGSKPAE